MDSYVHRVCSLTDPFCSQAFQAKLPDDNSIKTLTWQAKGYWDMVTDATGKGALMFTGDPENSIRGAFTWAGGSITSWSAPAPYPNMASAMSSGDPSLRVVSFGIRVVPITSSMTDSGQIGVLVMNPDVEYNAIDSPISVNDLLNYAANVRSTMKNKKGLAAVAFSTDIRAKQFTRVKDPVVGQATNFGFDILIPYVVGATPSTTVAQVEYVVNYEFTYGIGTTFNQLASPAAVSNPAILQGKGYVSRLMEQVVEGGKEAIEANAKYYAKRAFAGLVGIGVSRATGSPSLGLAGAQGSLMLMDGSSHSHAADVD